MVVCQLDKSYGLATYFFYGKVVILFSYVPWKRLLEAKCLFEFLFLMVTICIVNNTCKSGRISLGKAKSDCHFALSSQAFLKTENKMKTKSTGSQFFFIKHTQPFTTPPGKKVINLEKLEKIVESWGKLGKLEK